MSVYFSFPLFESKKESRCWFATGVSLPGTLRRSSSPRANHHSPSCVNSAGGHFSMVSDTVPFVAGVNEGRIRNSEFLCTRDLKYGYVLQLVYSFYEKV